MAKESPALPAYCVSQTAPLPEARVQNLLSAFLTRLGNAVDLARFELHLESLKKFPLIFNKVYGISRHVTRR
jgi:hypothetical protein